MSESKRRTVVFVDVDGTFVREHGTKRIPIPRVIAHIKLLASEGGELFCWSSGGAKYARESAQEAGIEDCFAGFLPKPDGVLDDQAISEWRYLRQVHPNQCDSMALSDYDPRANTANK